MKLRPLNWSARLILFVLAVLVGLSIDWRPKQVAGPPEVVEAFRTKGALLAGAAKTSLVPPFPTPIGGFSVRGNDPFRGVLVPPQARALVVQVGGRRMAFVSVELVVVDRALRDKVAAKVADLKLDDVVVGATHSHASVGGYWNSTLASWLGLGSYQARIETFLVDRIAAAIRQAVAHLVPASVSVGRIEASNYGANRDVPGGPVDRTLTGVRFVSTGGETLAQVIVFSVHPTILPMYSMKLSAEWPGAMSDALEQDGGGVALFFQGDVGDTTWGKRAGSMPPDQRMVLFGQAVASDARGAVAAGGNGTAVVELAHARVRFHLPPCDASGSVPWPLNRLASNLLEWEAFPGTGEVTYTELGPLSVAAVPGEVVAELGLPWQRKLHATLLGLTDAYLGYVETPERFRAREGEAKRMYFGAALPGLLFGALARARAAALGTP